MSANHSGCMERMNLTHDARKEAFLNELKRIQYVWGFEIATTSYVANLCLHDSGGCNDETLLESIRETITELELSI